MPTTSPTWLSSEAESAAWPRLAGARGSPRHALALREAFGEPAGQRLSRPAFDIGGRLSDLDITNVAAYVITTSSEGWD